MRSFFLIIIIFRTLQIQAQQPMPAFIRLDSDKQHDSIGYNLVKAIPELLNLGVHDGSIPIWDSPEKRKNLSGKLLKQLEEGNNTSFVHQQHLFMHEVWSTTKRKTEFTIIGISFIGENKTDSSKFNFGYIDMKDIKKVLSSNYIPINMNGNFQTTYWDALYHRDYAYVLLQLGNRQFTDPIVAKKYKSIYFNKRKRITNRSRITEQKYIIGYLNRETELKSPGVHDLFTVINLHFSNHKTEYIKSFSRLNLTESDTLNIQQVTAIEYGSIWRREGKFILTNPQYVLLYAGDIPLDTFSINQLDQWKERIYLKSVSDLLRDSEFELILSQINSTTIAKDDSFKFMQALRFAPWNKLEYQNTNR